MLFLKTQRSKTFFLTLVILELAAFILMANWIGVLKSIILICLSSTLGIALLQHQGFNLSQQLRAQANPQQGGKLQPAAMFAAILLIIPGFISSCIGLLLLIPQLRALLFKPAFWRRFYAPTHQKPANNKSHQASPSKGDTTIIEGEFEHESSATKNPQQPSSPKNKKQ